VSRCVTRPDTELNVTVLSILSLPMVQLWLRAPEAESHNTTAAKDLNLIAGHPSMQRRS
jgi:hypothetical protein